MCVSDFIDHILKLIGIEDSPSFKRTRITNMAEDTQMILSAADYLDTETVLQHLPFLSPDEIEDIMEKKQAEEAERFEQAMAMEGMGTETGEEELDLSGLEEEEPIEDTEDAEGEGADLDDLLKTLEDLLKELE